MTARRREPEIIELGFNQQWGSYLTMIAALVMLAGGLWLRNNAITATLPYDVPEVGIAVRYPARWLLDTTTTGVILRVQDAEAIPFKTSIQVSVAPVGSAASAEEVLRDLTINRANQNSTYRALGIEAIQLRGVEGRQQEYAYAAVETNPFLQSEPIIVRAVDVVVLRGSQAIIITFEADAQSYDQDRGYFEAFLSTLRF